MNVTVNGEEHTIEAGCTVLRLLKEVGIDAAQPGIAVALNGSVVPRSAWPETEVPAAAEIEIVRPLQGG
ncbi:MAG: sulfur carrier protein ThiS [bacterium]